MSATPLESFSPESQERFLAFISSNLRKKLSSCYKASNNQIYNDIKLGELFGLLIASCNAVGIKASERILLFLSQEILKKESIKFHIAFLNDVLTLFEEKQISHDAFKTIWISFYKPTQEKLRSLSTDEESFEKMMCEAILDDIEQAFSKELSSFTESSDEEKSKSGSSSSYPVKAAVSVKEMTFEEMLDQIIKANMAHISGASLSYLDTTHPKDIASALKPKCPELDAFERMRLQSPSQQVGGEIEDRVRTPHGSHYKDKTSALNERIPRSELAKMSGENLHGRIPRPPTSESLCFAKKLGFSPTEKEEKIDEAREILISMRTDPSCAIRHFERFKDLTQLMRYFDRQKDSTLRHYVQLIAEIPSEDRLIAKVFKDPRNEEKIRVNLVDLDEALERLCSKLGIPVPPENSEGFHSP